MKLTRFINKSEYELFNGFGINIAYFRLVIIVFVIVSCTKIEAQYAVCNLAQNVDPFVCYGILDD